MLVTRAFRYRIYPSTEQAARLVRWEGALRWLWNLAHEQRLLGLARTAKDKRYPSFYDQKKEATLLREEVEWLADVPANVCQDLLQRLDRAWQRCFDKSARRPHFKVKGHDSVSLCEPGKKVWRLEQKHGRDVLIFPKLGYVPIVLHRPLEGERATATITHDGDQWFVSIVCHLEVADPEPPRGHPVGVDRGIVNLVGDSTDHLEPRPAFLARAEAKIARASRKVSRTKKGSKNRAKARAKLGAIHRKVRRQREHLLHTLAHRYAKNHRVVVVEDLRIGNMVRSASGTVEEPGMNVAQKRGLNRRILQMGWGQLVVLLEQKAKRYGSAVVRVPAAFSSQECATCGHVDAANRPTQDRFECTSCGHQDHADLNAPKVLVKRFEESTRRTGGGDVCGGDSVGRPLKQKRRSVRTTTSPSARAQSLVAHGGDGLHMSLRVHHLSCGSFCPFGGKRVIGGDGTMVCHCLLVETERDGLLLVDTGFGTAEVRDPRGTLGTAFVVGAGARMSPSTTALAQVKALGFSPDDVRHIAVTHLDLDHAGGLADFPRARVHVHGAEQRAALAPSWRERARYKGHQWAHRPDWRLYDQSRGEPWFGFACVRELDGLPPEVLLVPLHGHTRGHVAVAVDTGAGWLLHAGDAYFSHGEVHDEGPPCAPMVGFYESLMAVDDAQRRANQTRLRELTRAHGHDVTVFCAHDPAELTAAARA